MLHVHVLLIQIFQFKCTIFFVFSLIVDLHTYCTSNNYLLVFNVRDVYFSLDYTFFTQVCGDKLETLCEEVCMYMYICVLCIVLSLFVLF